MITKVTGVLTRVLEEEVRLQVGAFEYQVLVPEFVRRSLQNLVKKELTLHTIHYLDGNLQGGRVEPRLLGFLNEADLDFFDLFCTVDKIGPRKALKALVRPVREVANAIQRQDSKWLTTLPGVGAQTAEKIIATLRRKVTRFAMLASATEAPTEGGEAPAPVEDGGIPATVVDGSVLEDAYQVLMSIGHSPIEARNRLDKVFASGKSFATVEEVLLEIYKQK